MEKSGGVSDEQIAEAVENYLIENPIEGGSGEDGASAYEISVKNGFKGTEKEWLESLNGSDGKNGADGKDGLNGSDGADGKTAYQYAQDGGYTGSEKEFAEKLAQENPTKEEFSKLSEDIADLKENGIGGSVSDEQIKKVVDEALTEAKESGEFDGEDGYTPQKGIDYFTEADKDQIVEEILENLPDIPSGESGSSGSETWTTLLDTVLEEDVNNIKITTDTNGNPFKAKKMRLTFMGVMTDARVDIYDNICMQNAYFYNAFKMNVYSRTVINIGEQLSNGLCKCECILNAEKIDMYYVLEGAYRILTANRPKKYLESINLNMLKDKYFTAGTRVIIEGVLE